MLSEDIVKFTLKDLFQSQDYGELEFGTDDVDTTNLDISSNGKMYRPSKTVSSGLPIHLLSEEFVGEYVDYEIDHYTYHYFSDDLSSINVDTLIFNERRLAIEGNILLEDGDELLLEDGVSQVQDHIVEQHLDWVKYWVMQELYYKILVDTKT